MRSTASSRSSISRPAAGLHDAVRAQVLAEGILELEDVVTQLVHSALASDLVKRAAARHHWREIYVGAPRPDGTLVEGIIDLLYREDDGSLVVVDYKTDVVTSDTLDAKVAFYRPQLEAYREMLATTVGGGDRDATALPESGWISRSEPQQGLINGPRPRRGS